MNTYTVYTHRDEMFDNCFPFFKLSLCFLVFIFLAHLFPFQALHNTQTVNTHTHTQSNTMGLQLYNHSHAISVHMCASTHDIKQRVLFDSIPTQCLCAYVCVSSSYLYYRCCVCKKHALNSHRRMTIPS